MLVVKDSTFPSLLENQPPGSVPDPEPPRGRILRRGMDQQVDFLLEACDHQHYRHEE